MSKETNKDGNWFKRHKIMTVLLALLVIGIISGAAGGGESNTASNNSNPAATPEASAETSTEAPAQSASTALAIKVGQAANDGKFEFIVKGMQCGQASVGTNEYMTKTAQGQYCLLSVSVKNIGNEKQSLFSANQKLLDAANKEYSADDMATMYAAPQGSSSWYSDINPGNSVEGTIVFDVPKGVTPTTAQLHDSAFSNGVKVSLQ